LALGADKSGAHRSARFRAKYDNGVVVTRENRLGFDTDAGSHSGRAISRRRNPPDVPAVDIVLIRRKRNRVPVRTAGDVLDFKVARREKPRGAAGSHNRIQMNPPVALPREDDVIVSAPYKLTVRHDFVEDAATSGFRAPELSATASRRICNADGPR